MPYLAFDKYRRRMKTITFGIPEAMYRALAEDMGRPGDYATDTEVEMYLRDVLKQNIEFMVETHLPKPKKTKLVIGAPKKKKLTIRRAQP